jgi:hypothetical protein
MMMLAAAIPQPPEAPMIGEERGHGRRPNPTIGDIFVVVDAVAFFHLTSKTPPWPFVENVAAAISNFPEAFEVESSAKWTLLNPSMTVRNVWRGGGSPWKQTGHFLCPI